MLRSEKILPEGDIPLPPFPRTIEARPKSEVTTISPRSALLMIAISTAWKEESTRITSIPSAGEISWAMLITIVTGIQRLLASWQTISLTGQASASTYIFTFTPCL